MEIHSNFLWPLQKTWTLTCYFMEFPIRSIHWNTQNANWNKWLGYRNLQEQVRKKIVNTYSFFSGKCLWLCLWKLGPPVSRRLPSRPWRGSSWGHSIEKFDSWYEKRYEQYQTILDPITLWIMQVWNCYDFFQIYVQCTYSLYFTWLERQLEEN